MAKGLVQVLCLAALVLALVACGAADYAPNSSTPCNPNHTYDLTVSPADINRNQDVVIVVTWSLAWELIEEAVAVMVVGDDAQIEVEVPLSPQTFEPATYIGFLQNPFGLGAPTGPIAVVAESVSSGCAPTTATTSFTLR